MNMDKKLLTYLKCLYTISSNVYTQMQTYDHLQSILYTVKA